MRNSALRNEKFCRATEHSTANVLTFLRILYECLQVFIQVAGCSGKDTRKDRLQWRRQMACKPSAVSKTNCTVLLYKFGNGGISELCGKLHESGLFLITNALAKVAARSRHCYASSPQMNKFQEDLSGQIGWG